MRTAQEDNTAAGFPLNPAGAFLLRDYSNDDTDDLKALRGLLEQILTRHKTLIPGSLNRLTIQWHADLYRAINAKNRTASSREDSQ